MVQVFNGSVRIISNSAFYETQYAVLSVLSPASLTRHARDAISVPDQGIDRGLLARLAEFGQLKRVI